MAPINANRDDEGSSPERRDRTVARIGVLDRRPELDKVLERLRPGDTLVVWRLDRLGRSLRHLIDTVTALDERGSVPLAAGVDRHDHCDSHR